MKKVIVCLVICLVCALGLVACGGGGGGSTPDNGGNVNTTAPSVPTDLTATAASSNSITLNWTASTDDVGVTGYKIFRDGAQISTSQTNSFSDAGLISSTTYTYTVSAYDTAGNNSAQTSPALSTTLATGTSDTTVPSVPTNLTATAVSTTQINLSWSASTDNVGVAGYEVYRSTALISTVIGTTYSDTGLSANTSYSYSVKAFDGANNKSAVSATTIATTPAASSTTDTQSPTVPQGFIATPASSSLVNLSWTASADNIAVTGYKIYRDGAYLKSESTTTAMDTERLASTQYCYTVSAVDVAGNESSQSGQSCAITRPLWAITTIDDGNMRNASIRLDSNQKAHISYYDNTNNAIKYATNASGAWSTETLATFYKRFASTMAKPSIAVDSTNKVHIIYLEPSSTQSCDGGVGATLKYISNATGVWTISNLDCVQYNGDPWMAIEVDKNNKIHIAYPFLLRSSNTYQSGCKYTTNMSDTWVNQYVVSQWSSNVYFYDAVSALSVDTNNKAHIILSTDDNPKQRYVTNVNGSWNTATLENGSNPSIAIAANKLHLSYSLGGNIKYSNNISGSWTYSPVTTDIYYGLSSIAVKSEGSPQILLSSYTGSTYLLKYASYISGSWAEVTIDSELGGFDISGRSLAIDSSGNARIIYGSLGLKYAEQQ